MRIISFNLAQTKEHDKIKDLILRHFTSDTIICFQEVSGSMYLFFEQYLRRDLPVGTKIFATPLHEKVHDKIQYQSILVPPRFEVQGIDMIRSIGFGQDPNKYILKVRFSDRKRKYTIFNVHGYVKSLLTPMRSIENVFTNLDKKRENIIVGDFNLNLSWFKPYLRKNGILELSHTVRKSFTVSFRDIVGWVIKIPVAFPNINFRVFAYKTDAVLLKSRRKYTYKVRQLQNDLSDHDLIILDLKYRDLG